MRDHFLDTRVRNANSQFSTLDTVLSGLSDLEGVLDETSTDGLHVMLNDFYARLQGLSNNVGNVEYATLVRSAAEKVVQTLNQYAFQFKQIREEQMSSFTITVDNLNTTIEKINEINAQIKDQTLRGGASKRAFGYAQFLSRYPFGYLNITVTPQDDGTVKVTSDGSVDVLDSHFDIELDGERVTLQRTTGPAWFRIFLPPTGWCGDTWSF
jgi:flagellar hook-associated protein FlgK